jgi:hypothetical protein
MLVRAIQNVLCTFGFQAVRSPISTQTSVRDVLQ